MPDHRWTRPESSTVRVRSWDGECVVYDARRGDTHLLSAVASCALHSLPVDGATVDELTELTAGQMRRPVDEQLRADVDAAMLRLQALGLCMPLSP